jgi:2-keto-3-deoxy-L-rhamnonate aldolase RhmA
MSKTVSLIVAAVAVVLAFVLNPSADKHREKIKEAIAARSQLEKVLGIGQLTSFASRYHSLGVASYTTVSDKVTSIGAYGMVFVPD